MLKWPALFILILLTVITIWMFLRLVSKVIITKKLQFVKISERFTLTPSVSELMPDSRWEEDPLPLQTFSFPSVLGRLVKLEVVDWRGLEYVNIRHQDVPPPVISSLTITGPGHDDVQQEMTFQPDYNETQISVPAHGDNIGLEIVLQGTGGVHQVSSPLIAYIRQEACYVTNLPAEFNPSQIVGESRETSVNSSEALHQYFINEDFYQIFEEIQF